MNKKITKIKVNNEIKEIRRLIENNEFNKAEFKSFELSEAIVLDKNNADPYFKNECVNIISKIIMKECNKEYKEELANKKEEVNSLEFIEQTARERLDMYLPNERVYVDAGM